MKGTQQVELSLSSGNIRRIRSFNGRAPNWPMDQVTCYSHKSPFSYLFSEMVDRGRSCGEVFRSCVAELGFWLLLSYFPTGKEYFPPILLWLAQVHTQPHIQRMIEFFFFPEKLMVVHQLNKFLFLTNRSSALKYLNSVQTLKPRFLKDPF